MVYHSNENITQNKQGTFVGKLSPNDASLDALFAKLGVAWLGYFFGLNLQDWLTLLFTLLSIVYVFFNTYVLIRDRVIKKPKDPHTDFDKLSGT